MQDSKGFCISEGRIGGWVQGSIITTEKSNWLVGQCMKTADVSLSALCGYAKHLPSCTTHKGSVIYWQNRSWEVFVGMQTDSAYRYSWQTYPDLAVSRLGSEVCENARFQRVLHFWRPNWWMSLGFDSYNREQQLTCWAMHEDSWCFLVSISALCGYAKHLPSCTEHKSSVIYWQNRLWEVIHWHADW